MMKIRIAWGRRFCFDTENPLLVRRKPDAELAVEYIDLGKLMPEWVILWNEDL